MVAPPPPAPLPPPLPPSGFAKAFWITFGLIGGLSLLSTAGAIDQNGPLGAIYVAWFFAVVAWLAAVMMGLGMLFARNKQAGAGVLAGAALGFLALAVTCFANLATVQIGG